MFNYIDASFLEVLFTTLVIQNSWSWPTTFLDWWSQLGILDARKVPYWGPTNIRHQNKKFSHLGNLVLDLWAPSFCCYQLLVMMVVGNKSSFKNIQNSFPWNTIQLESIFRSFEGQWMPPWLCMVETFWDLRFPGILCSVVLIAYWRFRTTYWSHLYRSRNPRRKEPLKKGPIGYPQHQ